MSAAPSLYRRHRPRTFADVIGQEHVVRTLRNAVTQGKLHHAYLFVGSRGTGKTSMAKILASCLNCVNGPTVDPCGACESCVSIASATSMDVIEMDAASNNSVEDIRELRESVNFAPVSGGYKVYILDEAHMLTTAAWNAFLKTLEEPPPQTIFVMATTEAQKVLPTVVDRCHRFDFTRPTVEQLASVLRRAATSEDIEIGPDAVALLARHATGSFRDALGTLEQLVTYAGSTVVVDDVLAVLGVADADLLFGSLDAIGEHDARATLHAAARLVNTGRDVTQFMKDLEAHARELLVVRTLGEVPPEIAVTPDRDVRLAEQAATLAPADVVRLLDLLAEALKAVKDGADARTQLELALVKAATPEVDASTKALLARLERLERGGAPSPPPPPQIVVNTTAAPPAAAPPPASAQPQASPQQAQAAQQAPPQAAAPVTPATSHQDDDGWPPHDSAPAGEDGWPADAQPASAPQPRAVASPPAVAQAVAAPAAVAVASAPIVLDFAFLLELWPGILDTVRGENALIGACLEGAHPVALEGDELVVAFAPGMDFNRKSAESNRDIIGDAIRTLAGSQPRLRFEIRQIEEDVQVVTPPTEEEWLDKLKSEFDAQEIVRDPEES